MTTPTTPTGDAAAIPIAAADALLPFLNPGSSRGYAARAIKAVLPHLTPPQPDAALREVQSYLQQFAAHTERWGRPNEAERIRKCSAALAAAPAAVGEPTRTEIERMAEQIRQAGSPAVDIHLARKIAARCLAINAPAPPPAGPAVREEKETCAWTHGMDPDTDTWHPECDPSEAYEFTDGCGPIENGHRHCCYCGRRLTEAAALERGEVRS